MRWLIAFAFVSCAYSIALKKILDNFKYPINISLAFRRKFYGIF